MAVPASKGGIRPAFAGDVLPDAAEAGRPSCHAARLASRGRVMLAPFVALIRSGRSSRTEQGASSGKRPVLAVAHARDLGHLEGRLEVEDQAGPSLARATEVATARRLATRASLRTVAGPTSRPAGVNPSGTAAAFPLPAVAEGKPHTQAPRALDHGPGPMARALASPVEASSEARSVDGPKVRVRRGHLLRVMANAVRGPSAGTVLADRAVPGMLRRVDLASEASTLPGETARATFASAAFAAVGAPDVLSGAMRQTTVEVPTTRACGLRTTVPTAVAATAST